MKRFLAVLVVFAVIVCFAGCGGETEKEFSRGVVTNGVYENEFIGIGAEFSDGWVYFTDEELNELNGITEELMGDDFEEYLKNATIIYDMYVMNTADASNININLEKLNVLAQATTANMETFVSNQMPTVQQSLENVGCTEVSYEIIDVKIGDETFKGAKITSNLQGMMMYQVLVCIKCDSGYMANVAIATYNTDTTQDILNKFYIVK